jgi:hypothetical protein
MKELTNPIINLLGHEGQQVEGDIRGELCTTDHTGGDGERKTSRKRRQMNGNKLGETPAKPDTTSTGTKKKANWETNQVGSRAPPARRGLQ